MKIFQGHSCPLAGLALGALLLCDAAGAQVLYGSLVGNVTDPSKAPVPAAAVTLTNTETNQSRRALTNDVGAFNFTTIPRARTRSRSKNRVSARTRGRASRSRSIRLRGSMRCCRLAP